jgi:hypothetical protein
MNTKTEEIQAKNISIYIDNMIYGKERGTWLSISTSGSHLFYLSWKGGRVYFFLDKLGNEIDNFIINEDDQSISFDYEGLWQDFATNLDNMVKKHFTIKFHDAKEFNRIIKFCN